MTPSFWLRRTHASGAIAKKKKKCKTTILGGGGGVGGGSNLRNKHGTGATLKKQKQRQKKAFLGRVQPEKQTWHWCYSEETKSKTKPPVLGRVQPEKTWHAPIFLNTPLGPCPPHGPASEPRISCNQTLAERGCRKPLEESPLFESPKRRLKTRDMWSGRFPQKLEPECHSSRVAALAPKPNPCSGVDP